MSPFPEDMQNIRMVNLRLLIKKCGGNNKSAKRMGYKSGSFLSQMTGPNPDRLITEGTARDIERKLGLALGMLDTQVDGVAYAQQRVERQRTVTTPDDVIALIRQIGEICDAHQITVSPAKLADLMTLAIANPDPEFLVQLVRIARQT